MSEQLRNNDQDITVPRRSRRSHKRALSREAEQVGKTCRQLISLTIGTPFRWGWRWVTSRSVKDAVIAVPAYVIGFAVVVFVSEVRNSNAEKLSRDYRVAAAEAIKNGETDAALMWLEQAVVFEPANTSLAFALAQLRIDQGDMARGLALMRRLAPEDRVGDPEAHLWMATVLGKNSKEATETERAKIEQHLKFVLANERHATSGDLLRDKAIKMLGDLALLNNDFEEAINYYRSICSRYPIVNLPLSMLLLDRGDHARSEAAAVIASSFFEQELKSSPDDVDLHRQYVQTLVLAREYPKAESAVKEFAKRNPDTPQTNEALAQIYVGWLNDKRSAANPALRMAVLEKALIADGDHPNVLVMLARLSGDTFDKTHPEKAKVLEAALQRALDDGIAPGLVHFILGTRSLSSGDISQAVLHLEVAAQLNVDVPETLNNLAWALAQADEPELERALALVERALQQKKRPEFFGTRGFILKEMGQRYAAIASFELSLPGHPNKEFVRKQLRELYSQP